MRSWWHCWWSIMFHKACVWTAGRRLGVPLWRLLIHDWSKFTFAEFPQYAARFYGDGGDKVRWDATWEHHVAHNPHHWQHWLTGRFQDWCRPRPMPEWAVREMVADWQAAGRVYSGSWPDPHNWTWYESHKHGMILSPQTKHILAKVLAELRGESNGRG